MTWPFLPRGVAIPAPQHGIAIAAQHQAITPPSLPSPLNEAILSPKTPPPPWPCCASALSPWRGWVAGGDRGTLVMCRRGPSRVQCFNVALVQHRPLVSPLTLAPGPGCPRMDEGDKLGGTHTAPAWSPPLHQDPPLPPLRLALALATSQGTGGHGHASRLF